LDIIDIKTPGSNICGNQNAELARPKTCQSNLHKERVTTQYQQFGLADLVWNEHIQ
jgi:hypothetical protein